MSEKMPARKRATQPAASGNTDAAMLRELRILSTIASRAELARRAGMLFGGKRNLAEVLGYKQQLEYKDFAAKYERQDIAGRIVDMPAQATWQGQPWITDSDADDETPFVKAWLAFVKRFRPFHYLERADRLAGIGRYSVMLLGVRDNSTDLSQPLDSTVSEDGLLYLSVFSEENAQIKSWVTDPQDPAFGRPETYEIVLTNGESGFKPKGQDKLVVHHSRLLHFAENTLEDDVFGRPRLLRVFDRLDDLAKVVGGGSEIFWLIAANLLHINVDPDVEVSEPDLAKLDEQVQKMMHHLQRTLQTQGASVNSIGGSGADADPTGIYDVVKELLAAAAEMPQRILFGSERGELASTQDQEEWHARVGARRIRFAEPSMLRPLIDRLIILGVLPKPEGDDYTITWPELDEPTLQERAEAGRAAAEAAAALSPSNPQAVLPIHELREIYLKLSPLPPEPPDDAGFTGNTSGKVANASVDEAVRRVADRLEPKMRRAFLSSVERMRSQTDVGRLMSAIARGDIAEAVRLTGVDELPRIMGDELRQVLAEAIDGGAQQASRFVPPKAGNMYAFTLHTNPKTLEWLQRHGAKLVVEITDVTRDAVKQELLRASAAGEAPATVARRIREMVGLTKRQMEYVRNHREREVMRGLEGEALERSVQRYAKQQLRLRGETIARNELITAAVQGQLDAWRDAMDKGFMRITNFDRLWLTGDDRLIQTGERPHIQCRCGYALRYRNDGSAVLVWVITEDEKLCDICAPMPALNDPDNPHDPRVADQDEGESDEPAAEPEP